MNNIRLILSAGVTQARTTKLWKFNMKEKARGAAAVLALLLVFFPGKLSAVVFLENNTYDFSQTGNNTWVNYCAPTVAGDLIYHFGNTYPSLVQGNPYGPGNQPGANNGVTDIIGGRAAVNNGDPPGPPAGSLAALMGTTRNGGTSLNNMKAGLVQYLANNSAIMWNTQELLAAPLGGAALSRHPAERPFRRLRRPPGGCLGERCPAPSVVPTPCPSIMMPARRVNRPSAMPSR